ncbi:hypothetical protein C2L65_25130 [Paraburkholderia terrae]|uniref:RiboL-PSP-HEPN domain-containing protein n=1 Tax=Paraburkholderia terrae TaxID=311230 RepID=A0A2I8ET99_9BURK|nr:hypothetical protein C2L65_25130 [Paraburkholderia terrae]
MTLHAAADLIKAGLAMDARPRTGTLSMGFSFFTGGMVLSFAAIESFSASVAFCMQSDERFPTFDFQRYRSERRFWDKMKMLMDAAGIEVSKGNGLFQQIAKMQDWRNLVTHASPYEIEPTEIADPSHSSQLHRRVHHRDYARSVDADSAKRFYSTAVDYIELVRQKTGITPQAFASYKGVE